MFNIIPLRTSTSVSRGSRLEVYCGKGALRNIVKLPENTCARISCLILKKKTLAQVFSREFCEISFFQNTFFYRTPPVAASESHQICIKYFIYIKKASKLLLFRNQTQRTNE